MKQLILYIKFAIQFSIENRTLKHIKQFKRWYHDMHSGESTMSLGLPWMTYDAIDFLEQFYHRTPMNLGNIFIKTLL